MATTTPNRNQRQKQAVIRLVIMAAILICVNILASYLHTGLDLTKEKRFTLSAPTKKLLRNMQEVAVIDVYLKGKFPAELQRMQEAIRERLSSFKDVAGNKIIFRFVDPFEGKSDDEKKQVVHDMAQKGVMLKELQNNNEDDEEYSMKVFFPYALVQYNGREMPILLTEYPPGKTRAEQISYSEALLEYKFSDAIIQLGKPQQSRIGYMVGNGEELGIHTVDMLTGLTHFYNVDTFDLSHAIHIPLAFDAIIINKPTIPFTGPDKLKIDQYIMHGGHVLWALSSLNASIDSFANSPQFIAMDYGLNLDDILFKYGIRVNNDLIEDRQNVPLPRELNGQTELHEWVYFPRFNPTSEHPIVKNMDFILGKFTNSIDTIRTAILKKTILLESSKYSRVSNSPVRVSLTMMSYPLNNEMFNKPYKPVAVLVEGKFISVYNNRLAPEYLKTLDSLHETFKSQCDSDNSMIVTSIGDIFNNDYSTKDGPLPMGYYKYTGEYFANRTFLLNCLEYLTDHSGILEARSKDVKLRLLDNGRVKDEKTKWQVINVSIPIALVLVFASCYLFFRKRKYEQPKQI